MSFTLYLPGPPSPGLVSSSDRSGAAESALGDLALIWSNTTGSADLSLVGLNADLAVDRGLITAVVLSLFTDRRAEDDDVPPSGDPRDRRGWWADEFLEVEGDRHGSRLWLLDRSKRTNETAIKAKEYILEALAWVIEDKVAPSVDVTITIEGNALIYAVGIPRPGRDAVSFRFAHVWDHMQETT